MDGRTKKTVSLTSRLGLFFLRAERKNLSSLFAPVVQGVGGRVTLEPRAYGGETLRTQS